MGRGVGDGCLATSSGCTGSARRTSGSAPAAEDTTGVEVGTTVGAGVGAAGLTSFLAAGVVLSKGWAWGAIILSEIVALATGVAPGVGEGLGLSRCTWRSDFITVNPMTSTSTPMTNGQSDVRSPLLRGRRTTTGRLGIGSGAS